MKTLSTLLLAAFAGFFSIVSAQTFSAVTFPFAEDTNVPNAANLVSRTQHTSCYSRANANIDGEINNLYLYTWNSLSASGTFNGIGWIRRDPSDNFIDEGNLPLNGGYRDLEAGFIEVGGVEYVIATYYKIGLGHAYDIYKWGIAGLVPYSTGNVLYPSAVYGRISLDIDRDGIAVAWQDAQGIKVKAIGTAGGVLTIGNSVLVSNAPAGVIPDVAFCRTATTYFVRIAYVDNNTGKIFVMHQDFATLLAAGASMPFIIDDGNPVGFPVVSSGDVLTAPNSLNLDCPDNYPFDNWSYVYTTDNQVIKGRTMSLNYSSTPFDFFLDPGLTVGGTQNIAPTIAYDVTGQQINYGWCTTYNATGFVAVTMYEDGSNLTLPGFYNVVTNSQPGVTIPVMSFNKQDDGCSQMYVAFPVSQPGAGSGFEMHTKLVPWGSPTVFRPGGTTGVKDIQEVVDGITVYPNPFSDAIVLKAPADQGEDVYAVHIADISGKAVLQLKGSLGTLNDALAQWSPQAGAGIYFLKLTTVMNDHTQVWKIVKKR